MELQVQTGDGSFNTEAVAEESAKIEAAKEALIDEAVGTDGSDLILGKYGSTEELAKAYQSLQAEFSKYKGEAKEPTPEQESSPDSTPPVQEQAQPERSGPTPEQAAQIQQSIFEQTGGEAKYNAIAGWAIKAYSPEQCDQFNEAIQSGDESRALSAVKGLQYDYLMATGFEPKLAGGRPPAPEQKGFESEAQVVAAMNDPRYRQGPSHDPAFVEEVTRKLVNSNVFS